MKSVFRTAFALALVTSLGLAETVSAQTVKGTAELGLLRPVTKIVGKEVVTTLKIKNLSKGSISGLRVDEYWYDKEGNASPGDSKRLGKPLAAGAVTTIELRTPRTAGMDRNNYQFSHANGQVTTKVLPKIE